LGDNVSIIDFAGEPWKVTAKLAVMRLLLIVSTLAAGLVVGQATARDGIVHRDGLDLHYRTIGSGRLLVLLSGGPGIDVDYMLPVAQELGRSFECVLFEQRGTGRSRSDKMPASQMSVQNAVEDLEALRQALQQDRLLILGHSWGGMLAMAYAAAHPDHVDAMILAGPGGMDLKYQRVFGDNINMRLWPQDKDAVDKAMAMGRSASPDEAGLAIMTARTPAYFYDRDTGLKFARETPAGSFHQQAFNLLMLDASQHYNVRNALRSFDRPVLILQGHQDPIGDSNAYEIHSVLKNSEITWLNRCGHFGWIEQPQDFYKAVRGFLDHPQPRASE